MPMNKQHPKQKTDGGEVKTESNEAAVKKGQQSSRPDSESESKSKSDEQKPVEQKPVLLSNHASAMRMHGQRVGKMMVKVRRAGANKDKLTEQETQIIINLAKLTAKAYTELDTKLEGIEISENKRLFLKLFGHFFFGILDEIPGVNEVSSLIATIIDLSYDLSEIKTSLHIDSQTFGEVYNILEDFLDAAEGISQKMEDGESHLGQPLQTALQDPSLETHDQPSGSKKFGAGKKKQTKKNKKTKGKKRKKKTKAKN